MSILETVLKAVDGVNEVVAKLMSWAVILIVLATVYEVVMRYVFNAPTQWVFEFNYLLHGPYFLLLGAYTLAVRGHVNVDIFYARLSHRKKAVVDLITAPVFFFFAIMMMYWGAKFALTSLAFRERLSSAWAPPVYPVKLIIPLAAALLFLQGLSKFLRDLHTALKGQGGEL